MILSLRVLAAAGLLSLASSALAQHAVRDEFPNGAQRGERFEHFTKEQWGHEQIRLAQNGLQRIQNQRSCSLAVEAKPALVTARSEDPSVARPNLVIINIDDLGYADIGPFGSKKNKTPRLDRMAAEGRVFTSFYAAAPLCSPSRAALMTGSSCRPRDRRPGHWPAVDGRGRGPVAAQGIFLPSGK